MKCLISVLLLVLSIQVIAQIPEAISYQGIARRNNVGEPPLKETNITLRASVLSDLTDTVLYSESHNVTTSKSGVFTISIGLGTIISGVFSDIDWGNGERFLKVEIPFPDLSLNTKIHSLKIS